MPAVVLDADFWARLLGIGVLNLILSGDNAVVIALAVRMLPRRERMVGLVGGTFGAVAARLVFAAVAIQLFHLPLVKLIGGGLLLWIAIRLVQGGEADAERPARHGANVREAVGIIIIADVVMSLDNVLAVVAAARGDLFLVVLGVALSIPIVMWGSGLLASWMGRFPWIVWLGGGALGWVAGEMIAEEELLHPFVPATAAPSWIFPACLALFVTALGWRLAVHAAARAAKAVS
jgi:YjbE family integral membrane protein